MANTYRQELAVAVAAVRAAAVVCQAVRSTLVGSQTIAKADRSPVTVADFASQAVVGAVLDNALPNDPIVGEENAGELRRPSQDAIRNAVVQHAAVGLDQPGLTERRVLELIDRGGLGLAQGPRFWTIDPIDGTKGFLRGGQYAVALALIEDGQVVLAVLGCPNLPVNSGATGVLLAAVKGQGAHLLPLADDNADHHGQPVHVSAAADLRAARFCESHESSHSSHDHAAAIAADLGITAQPLRMDSQAKYATVARGDTQIYMRLPTRSDYREKIWDHAAGMLVVTEAGGRVTDIHGQPLDFNHGRQLETNQGIVATNNLLHNAVIDAIAVTLNDPIA